MITTDFVSLTNKGHCDFRLSPQANMIDESALLCIAAESRDTMPIAVNGNIYLDQYNWSGWPVSYNSSVLVAISGLEICRGKRRTTVCAYWQRIFRVLSMLTSLPSWLQSVCLFYSCHLHAALQGKGLRRCLPYRMNSTKCNWTHLITVSKLKHQSIKHCTAQQSAANRINQIRTVKTKTCNSLSNKIPGPTA